MNLNMPARMVVGAAIGGYSASRIPDLPAIGPLSPELALVLAVLVYFMWTGGMAGDAGDLVDGALIGLAAVAATRISF